MPASLIFWRVLTPLTIQTKTLTQASVSKRGTRPYNEEKQPCC